MGRAIAPPFVRPHVPDIPSPQGLVVMERTSSTITRRPPPQQEIMDLAWVHCTSEPGRIDDDSAVHALIAALGKRNCRVHEVGLPEDRDSEGPQNELVGSVGRQGAVLTHGPAAREAIAAARAGNAVSLLIADSEGADMDGAAVRDATYVLCCTNDVRRRVWRSYRRRGILLDMEPDDVAAPSPDARPYLTVLRPTADRGAHVFAALAEHVPERTLLCVGPSHVPPASNVEHIATPADMATAWDRTLVRLEPLAHTEAFTSGCHDSALHGVPTLLTPPQAMLSPVNAGVYLPEWRGGMEALEDAVREIESNYGRYWRSALMGARAQQAADVVTDLLASALRRRSGPNVERTGKPDRTTPVRAKRHRASMRRQEPRRLPAGAGRPAALPNTAPATSIATCRGHAMPVGIALPLQRTVLAVQIVTANRTEELQQTVTSLLEHTHNSFQLQIWANASPPQTLLWLDSMAARPHPGSALRGPIRTHRSDTNEGFILPNNRMVRHAAGRYIVIANDDLVFGPGWDAALIGAFEATPRLAAAGPLQVCRRISAQANGVAGEGPIEYIEGSCLCLPREVVERYGLFDERMRLFYCEDTELSLRLRALGYEITEVPECDVKHLGGSTRKSSRDLDRICRDAENHNKAILRERYADYLRDRVFPQHTVIVRRRAAHGDLVDLEPALAGIRERFPWSKIVLETACADLMAGCPHVDEIRGFRS